MSHRSNQTLLQDLGNVDFASLLNDQNLRYNSSTQKWYNASGGAGGSAAYLNDMIDVAISTLYGGENFTYNTSASSWGGRIHLIDVRDFGAVPDNSAASVASANVTAIQSAINFAYLLKGRGIFLSGLFYVSGGILLQEGLEYVGAGADTSGFHDTRTSGLTLSASVGGGSSGSRLNWIRLENLRVIGNNGGTNTRTAIYLENVSKARFTNVNVWSTKIALHARNLWDSTFEFCRFDQCGVTTDSSVGVVRLEGNSGDDSDTDSTRWYNCTWESNYGIDLYTTYSSLGGVKANNKLYFIGCKFENSASISTGAVNVVSTHHIHFDNCHFSHGKFGGAHSTAIPVLKAANCEDIQITSCDFEAQVTSPSGTRIDEFIWIAGGNEHVVVRDNSFAVSGNQTIGTACIRYSGTNNKVVDEGNDFRYIAAGTPALRSGRPTTYANKLQSYQLRHVYTNTTILPSDEFVVATASAGPITLTLPATSDAPFEVTIKKFDSTTNAVTVDTADSAVIDGSATFEIPDPYEAVTFILLNTSNWVAV